MDGHQIRAKITTSCYFQCLMAQIRMWLIWKGSC